MVFKLPKLSYEFNALEPFIDEKTMRIHYEKHHQAYIDKLNGALEKYPELQEKDVEELISNRGEIPEEIRNIVRNHGGGHANHSFFWKILKKDTPCKGEILKEIESKFGNLDGFKEKFIQAATGQFGSGWAWLVFNSKNDEIEIMTTPNQDSPLMQGKIPLLGVDVWEHAYYLKYQNKRADYVDAFFNVINWERVNENFLKAKVSQSKS